MNTDTCHANDVIVNAASVGGYVEPRDVNDHAPVTELGSATAAYFNMNIADGPTMFVTDREGEALVQFVVAQT